MRATDRRVPENLTVLPDPGLFRTARRIQVACLGISGAAIIIQLLSIFGTPEIRELAHASLPLHFIGLASAISLGLSGPGDTGNLFVYAGRTARAAALISGIFAAFWMRALANPANPLHGAAPPADLAIGFVLLSVAVLLVDNANWLINRIVDVLVCVLSLLAIVYIADFFFQPSRLSGPRLEIRFLLVSLVGLTVAITLRQAEHGVLSVFLGIGSGSKMARIFAPILLVISFAWAGMNARIGQQWAGGLLAAAAVALFSCMLLVFAWRISRMENEIHDLVLRDEATRLYNSRGFHLLAEHALRLAKRSKVPFSILFVEMENLAEIHAQFGPQAAGASLAEAGEILKATFRESDIKGRIGAADFAVAGQFDRTGISVAALRLEFSTAARASKTQGPAPLKLSMGHVTTLDSGLQESLQDLLERAGRSKNRIDLQMSEMRVN